MKGIMKELFGWILFIVIVVAVSYLVVTFVGQRTQVSGESMETTLSDGDHLIVDKITYRFRDPKRYDIVVFPYRYEENTYYIKRIIGLPGETVQIVDGYVYINGVQLDEHYGNALIKGSENVTGIGLDHIKADVALRLALAYGERTVAGGHNDGDQILAYSRGNFVFVFNFSPTKSFTDYGFLVPKGEYEVVLNTDAPRFGGFGLADDSVRHFTQFDPLYKKEKKEWLKLYIPARSAVVLRKVKTKKQ